MFDAHDFADMYADLGGPVTYTPLAGAAVTGAAIFASPGSTALGDEVVITEPSLRFRLADFPAVVRGGTFLQGGTTWRVRQAPTLLLDGQEAIVPLERVA